MQFNPHDHYPSADSTTPIADLLLWGKHIFFQCVFPTLGCRCFQYIQVLVKVYVLWLSQFHHIALACFYGRGYFIFIKKQQGGCFTNPISLFPLKENYYIIMKYNLLVENAMIVPVSDNVHINAFKAKI